MLLRYVGYCTVMRMKPLKSKPVPKPQYKCKHKRKPKPKRKPNSIGKIFCCNSLTQTQSKMGSCAIHTHSKYLPPVHHHCMYKFRTQSCQPGKPRCRVRCTPHTLATLYHSVKLSTIFLLKMTHLHAQTSFSTSPSRNMALVKTSFRDHFWRKIQNFESQIIYFHQLYIVSI